MIAFKALYGMDPPFLFQGATFPSKVEEVNNLTIDRDLMLDRLKSNLFQAQQCMKNQADKKRREVEFQVGDWVY